MREWIDRDLPETSFAELIEEDRRRRERHAECEDAHTKV
jgi:macrodomain Ter protein organizer (MatP/YcbG family)